MFITFEGIDGSGKSTQAKLLADVLTKSGFQVILTRQPGGTKIGQSIRKILLDHRNFELIPTAEILLFIADRIQHLQEIIIPALQLGKIVICDRYHDSTLAYQCGGRKIDMSYLDSIKKRFIINPDLTLWLDISIKESKIRCLRRLNKNKLGCRIESEKDDFFIRVRDAYRSMQYKKFATFIRICPQKTIESVRQEILNIVLNRMKLF